MYAAQQTGSSQLASSFGLNQTPAQEAIREVPRNMARLSESVDYLRVSLDRLNARLSPVTPPAPVEQKAANQPGEPIATPIGGDLARLEGEIRKLAYWVDWLSDNAQL